MLINFALEAVGTKISSNKISTDGCECCNLISSDFRCRNKGFVAEHFIKPPVDITLTFSCHVNIFCVLLNPFVGQQQSSQMEVFCSSKPIPKTKHGQRLVEEKHQTSSVKEEPLPLFYPVSKITSPNQTRICFYSGRFPASSRYKNMISSFETHALAEMRHSKPELLTAVSNLMIRISRTQNGSTPALSNIEVWGFISSQVSGSLRKIICDKYQAFSQPQMIASSLDHGHVPPTSTDKKSEEKQTAAALEDIQIPEEFLDPLTCEIMSIPMLLPCGKNVDKATLDRYFDSEASHGRQPRDPFTGVEFHGQAKPIPNGSLKARIDHFLSRNSNDPSISSLPRTVISGRQHSCQQKRKQSPSLDVSSIVKKRKNVTQTQIKSPQSLATSSITLPLTSSILHQSPSTSLSVNHQAYSKKICPEQEALQKETETQESDTKCSHESSLKDSLNYALSALLGSSSANSEKYEYDAKKSGPQHQLHSSCSRCEKELSETVVTYAFPCSHFLCRLCLLSCAASESRIICFKCGNISQRSDIVRTHSNPSC